VDLGGAKRWVHRLRIWEPRRLTADGCESAGHASQCAFQRRAFGSGAEEALPGNRFSPTMVRRIREVSRCDD
jgi:hypothetical protein